MSNIMLHSNNITLSQRRRNNWTYPYKQCSCRPTDDNKSCTRQIGRRSRSM